MTRVILFEIEQDRYYAEKERFLNGQRPDYPEYPTDESLFKRIDWMINRINDNIRTMFDKMTLADITFK